MSTSPLTPARLLSPATVLLLLLVVLFLGMLTATLVSGGLGQLFDIDPTAGPADADAAVRYRIRALLFAGQALTFLIPGLLLARWLYGKRWLRELRLRPVGSGGQLLVGVLILFSGIGLVAFAYQINQALPLPAWATAAEERTGELLEAVLRMDSAGELIVNLLLVGVLAGVGEEIVFRGLLQPTLTRLFGGRRQAAVWVTAIIFSAVHFQWSGFLPRVVLGVLLGYLLLLSGRLWVPIVAHVFNNAAQVAAAYWVDEATITAAAEQTPTVTPLQAGCSLLLVLLGAFALQRISPPPVPPPSTNSTDA